MDRFILQEVLVRRRVMLMLRVMMYVVSYKQFWNEIGVEWFVSHEVCCAKKKWRKKIKKKQGVVRFQVVSHEVCSDKVFVNWHFLHFFLNCVVVITEYLNWDYFQYPWIGKPNKTLKLSAPQTIFLLWKQMRRRQDFLCENNALQAKLM